MKKILTVIGARPQFIKAAVVSSAFACYKQDQEPPKEIIVHTGQHFDFQMSGVFFEELGIPEPKVNLGISGMSHGSMTGLMLQALEPVIQTESPDIVLVYGDTNSTLAASLCAVKLGIPIAHVEAGLRSFNTSMPEEINRVLTDRIATLLYCPSKKAEDQLAAEGIPGIWGQQQVVNNVGDVMFDAALKFGKYPPTSKTKKICESLMPSFFLATVHRQENTQDEKRFSNILKGLSDVSKNCPVLIPAHPRIKHLLEKVNLPTTIHIIDPVGYVDMLFLIKNSLAVLTDSGGLQKEAFFCKRACVVLREETEWTELVSMGCNFVAGVNPEKIQDAATSIFNGKSEVSTKVCPYGDGFAGEKIAKSIYQFLYKV